MSGWHRVVGLCCVLSAACASEGVDDAGVPAPDGATVLPGPLELELSFGTLEPAFQPDVQAYTLSRYTALGPRTVTVRGASVASVDGLPATPGVPTAIADVPVDDSAVVLVLADGKPYAIRLLPPDFPRYTVLARQPSPGWLYLSGGRFLLVVDEDGGLVFFHRAGEGGPLVNFQRHTLPDGGIRHSYLSDGRAVILDERLRPLSTLQMKVTARNDSVETGQHELLLLGDGHVMLESYVPRRVSNVPTPLPTDDGGSWVVAAYVQEQRDGQVLWEWDSTEHPELYALSTAFNDFTNTRQAQDYAHLNSLSIDPQDGNVVISFRHLDAVLKVERPSGRILWRLGGGLRDAGVADSFDTPPDWRPSQQHTATVLGQGQLSLFDNRRMTGSRVSFFTLDPPGRRVADFNELRLPYIVAAAGSAQVIPGGRVVVGLGIHNRSQVVNGQPAPDVLELDRQSGAEHFRLRYAVPVSSYRALKYPALPPEGR